MVAIAGLVAFYSEKGDVVSMVRRSPASAVLPLNSARIDPSRSNMSADEHSGEDFGPALLSPEESLDDDELGDIDAGYSPPDRPLGSTAWGITERELSTREDLTHRLAREEPEPTDVEIDGLGDTSDTDGELIDDQVGAIRAGRLVAQDAELDSRSDFWAHDVGVDNAAASAEEAAVHVVPDTDEEDG